MSEFIAEFECRAAGHPVVLRIYPSYLEILVDPRGVRLKVDFDEIASIEVEDVGATRMLRIVDRRGEIVAALTMDREDATRAKAFATPFLEDTRDG